MLLADRLILAFGFAFTVAVTEAVEVQVPLVAVTLNVYPPELLLLNVASLVVLVKVPPLLAAQL